MSLLQRFLLLVCYNVLTPNGEGFITEKVPSNQEREKKNLGHLSWGCVERRKLTRKAHREILTSHLYLLLRRSHILTKDRRISDRDSILVGMKGLKNTGSSSGNCQGKNKNSQHLPWHHVPLESILLCCVWRCL